MTTLVIDASVAVKLFHTDQESEKLADTIGQFNCVAPRLMRVEFANAFWKYAAAGQIEPLVAFAAVKTLDTGTIRFVSDSELLVSALEIGIAHKHPIYDCLYLALALRDAADLATQDRRLRRIAGAAGVNCLDMAA